MYYGYWGFGTVISIIFWIVLIALVIWAFRGPRHHYFDPHHYGPRPNRGLDILNERYAKGEITKEEYEQKKKDILG